MRLCNKIIEYGLLFLIVFTPLAFGSVHVWAYSLMELTLCLMVITWMIKLILLQNSEAKIQRTEKNNHILRVNIFNSLYLPAILFIALILFQLLPLPPKAIKFLSPNTYSLYKLTLPGYDVASPGKPSNEFSISNINLFSPLDGDLRSISIYRHATETGLYKILSYFVLFFLIINNFRFESDSDRKKEQKTSSYKIPLNRIITTIITMGFILSFLGILQKLSGTSNIFWLSDKSYASHFGSHINRNHFAGYINMIISLVMGVIISRKILNNADFSIKRFNLSVKNTILSLERLIHSKGLYVLTMFLMISGLILSTSRGGTISFLVSILIFLFLIYSRKGHKKKSPFPFLIILAVILSVFWFGTGPLTERFEPLHEGKFFNPDERYYVFSSTWKMAGDFPFLGTGLESFQYIFPMYKSAEIKLHFTRAHNDYLQLLVETGWAGFLLVFYFFVVFSRDVLSRLRQRRNPLVRGITIGGLTGISTMFIHSFVDFNMQIPANAVLFFVLLGIVHVTVRS